MRPWYEELFSFLANLLTKQSLSAPGAAWSTTISATGYSRSEEEDGKRAVVVAFMRSNLGKVYQFGIEVSPGQEDTATAWDCSELTEAAYRRIGHPLPDGAQQQYDETLPCVEPMPGDLGFLWSDTRGKIGHVMVYADHGALIHAVGGRGVVEDPSYRWETNPRWRGWRRHRDFARQVDG